MTKRDPNIRLGLALGSGGARGLSHAGALQALEAAGLPPDLVVGTSMGAVVGAVYAETADAEETWRRLAALAEDPDFLSTWQPFIPDGSGEENESSLVHDLFATISRKIMAIRAATRPSLVSAERLQKPLRSLLRTERFEDLKLPFAAVGVDLISGEKVVFDSGDLVQGVYASAAIPGVFPPLELEGRTIVDGGAPFRVPVGTCREMGADLVVAVNVPAFDSAKPRYKTGMDMIMRSDMIAKQRLDDLVMRDLDVVVSPEVSDYHWADFRCAELCRRRGYEATREALPELLELFERRGGFWRRLMSLVGR